MIYNEKTPKTVRLKLDFFPFSIALFRTTTTSAAAELRSACRGRCFARIGRIFLQFSQRNGGKKRKRKRSRNGNLRRESPAYDRDALLVVTHVSVRGCVSSSVCNSAAYHFGQAKESDNELDANER